MSENLNFFKGLSADLPDEINRKSYSFYLTEDEKDFYYSNENKELIRMAANPSNTIKEIHTLYSRTSNTPPESYPLDENSPWTDIVPEYQFGEQIYSIKCIIYMDGNCYFSKVQELITQEEIDEICLYEGGDVE